MMLQLAGVHAYYGKSHILHGVDLDIDAREIVSLLGRNGVGRSTTCKAVMGLVAANLYIVAFGMSWGPVMWVLLGEMFPNRLRGAALAVLNATNRILGNRLFMR